MIGIVLLLLAACGIAGLIAAYADRPRYSPRPADCLPPRPMARSTKIWIWISVAYFAVPSILFIIFH